MRNRVFFSFIALLIWQKSSALSLSQAYQKALDNEATVVASRFRTEAVDEQVNQAKSRLYPQLQANASAGQNKYQPNYNTSEVSEPYKNYSISAYMPIYRPELWSGIDQAKIRKKEALYRHQRISNTLGIDVAKAYFDLARALENIKLTQAQSEAYEAKYRQLSGMLELGLSNKMDVLEAKVHFDSSRAEALVEKQRYNTAKLALEYMIGESIHGELDVDLSAINPDALVLVEETWDDKLSENPSVKVAEMALKVASKEIEIRKYEHYPKVDLRITRSETDTKDPSLREYDSRALIEVNFPIYSGGVTQSRIKEAKLLESAAIKELENVKKSTKLKLEQHLADRALGIEKLKAMRESEASALLYLSSIEQGYEKGLKHLIDLLEARAKLHQVRRDIIDAAYVLILAQLNIIDMSGELSAEKIAEIEVRISLK
ncbi:MAG: TolC family protein [Wolinella sp.]